MVEAVISRTLETSGPEAHLKLLQSTGIAERLVKAENDNKAGQETGKPREQSMPFIHQIGHSLQMIANNNEACKPILEAVSGWEDFYKIVKEEKEMLEALVHVEGKEQEEPALFIPKLGYDALENESLAYTEGRDRDEEDLSLPDDVDMDSANDADDYDIEQAEILLTKQEIEAFA